jgi:superoxide dismutase, Fe-Mn family
MKYDTLTDIILEQFDGYKPVKLPYNFDSLEPYIDAETMKLHYNKHYKGYLKKLNDAIGTKKPELEQLVKSSLKRKDAIRNNAGGAYNHQLFWSMMSPDRPSIRGKIKELLEAQYGSVENFKEQFKEQAISHFGSGWVWLVKKGTRLKIIQTDNQDNPLMYDMGTPILGIDVWEHAYYKKYGPDRGKYINQFLKIVNWDYCNLLLGQ